MTRDKKNARFTRLFKQEYSKLKNYVTGMVNYTAELDPEDIVQDVMTNIYEKADFTLPFEEITAYIYRSLKNKVIDFFRKKRSPLSLDEQAEGTNVTLKDLLLDMRYDTFTRVEQDRIKAYFYETIESLSDNDKAIIISTEFENKSFKELSEEWDIPLGTLLARKSRALKKIHDALEEHFISY